MGGQGHQGGPDLLPVDDDHRQDGAGLDGDVEDLGLVIVEAQQRTGQDQVPGARDGQELGEPLHHPHDRGLGQQDDIHAHSLVIG